MRHQGVADLLRLAVLLSGTREGLTIDDILEEFEKSRRTVERMLAALGDLFPELEAVESDERKKRWRLVNAPLRGLMGAEPVELAELEAAARRARDEGAQGRAGALSSLAGKLRAAIPPAALRRAAPDVEMLMEAEGTAIRPGPRPAIPETRIHDIRHALLASRVLRLTYGATPLTMRERFVAPLGLLHGQRPYLVATEVGTEEGPRMYRLDRIAQLHVTAQAFERDPAFSLHNFAARSFGVFQEDPFDVCLRFSADAASEASAFHFHATQQLERLSDGRLLVRFRAGGRVEMCQHLVVWNDAVEILQPSWLRKDMAEWSQALASHHAQNPKSGDVMV